MAGTIKRIATLEEEDDVRQDKPLGTISSGNKAGGRFGGILGIRGKVLKKFKFPQMYCFKTRNDLLFINFMETLRELSFKGGKLFKKKF